MGQFVIAIEAGALVHVQQEMIELLQLRHAEWKAAPGDISRMDRYQAALKSFSAFVQDRRLLDLSALPDEQVTLYTPAD